MIVLDSHCDSPSQMHRLRNFGIDNARAQVDFPKMIKGGVDASFFALFTPNTLTNEQAAELADKMMAVMRRQVGENADKVAFAYSAEEVYMNKDKGLISILIGMENGSPICGSLDKLRDYYRQGVRYLTLTHNGDNDICDSCAGNHRWGGLSPFGKEVVAEMNRLGMIIDIAHCADDTVRDCLKYSKAPIVTTHSCCKALASHRRNLTDELIKAIAEKGGVIQINFYPVFLSDEFANDPVYQEVDDRCGEIEKKFRACPSNPEYFAGWQKGLAELESLDRPSYKVVVDHIDHVVKIAGVDHVGLGSDFDGIDVTPAGLEDISKFQIVIEELRLRGYSEEEIAKIAGGNFLRVMKVVQDIANQ